MNSRANSRRQRGPRTMRNSRSRRNDNSVATYAGDAWSLAKRTALGLNEIRKLINVEEKYLDVSGTAVAPAQAGTYAYLSGMSQGDDIALREGDSIKVQKFRFAAQISRNIASTATGEWVRVLVFRDLQNSGVAVTGGEVIAMASTVYAPISPLNVLNGPAYNKRFSIVYDETVRLDSNQTCENLLFMTAHDCHVYYRGSGNTTAAAGNGSYHVLFFCNTTTNLPSIDYVSRIDFTDN